MEKIIGIGNALVDILVRLEDDVLLERVGLPKGGMTLIDEVRQKELRTCMAELSMEQATGGSAGNSMLALARLGGNAGFVGKVGRDALGKFYADNCKKVGIEARLLECNLATGVANTFISPDGERTFGTLLGAAATMQPGDITPQLFEGVSMAHIEGYLVQNHDLMEAICQMAMEQSVQLSLDLASYNVVAADLPFFQHLVQDYIDIVFANEEEAAAFTGKRDPLEALRENRIPIDRELVACGRIDFDEACKTTNRLLDLPNPPDAILAFNDIITYAAFDTIKSRGLRIPQDVAIIGFTDGATAAFVTPKMSAIVDQAYEQGRKACELLIRNINGDRKIYREVIPMILKIQESSRKR